MEDLNDDFYSLHFDEGAKYPPPKLKYNRFMCMLKNHGKHHHQYQCTCVRRSNISCNAKVYLPNDKDSCLSVETKGKHDRQCCVVNGLDPIDPKVDYQGKHDDNEFEEEAAAEDADKENAHPNDFELSPRPTKIRAIRLPDVTQEMRAIAQKYGSENLRINIPDPSHANQAASHRRRDCTATSHRRRDCTATATATTHVQQTAADDRADG